jgi:pre-60S factor REI1
MENRGEHFFSATSNVGFRSEQELHQHYRSAFHRYNLKRRVAGLGPVTKEWFELHRDKLLSAQSATKNDKDVVYFDPLSRKTFNSESKYDEFTNSNKYKKLVKANGGIRPDPVRRAKPAPQAAAALEQNGGNGKGKNETQAEQAEEMDSDSDSWETASEDEGEEAGEGSRGEQEPWDVCVSLFDNHRSKSCEDNIEYMYKNFGFSIPDVENLANPEGLIQYLGAKISQGRIPLYTSGLDHDAKSFGSMHAVQRHMVDTGKTRMLYEDNEDEYEDFYDYSAMEAEMAERMESLQLAETTSSNVAISDGYSLFIPGKDNSQRVLGSRGLAKYYKQSHRPTDQRQSVLANKIVARYRMLGLLKMQEDQKQIANMNDNEVKRRQNTDDVKLHSGIQNAVIWKLPRNVPY